MDRMGRRPRTPLVALAAGLSALCAGSAAHASTPVRALSDDLAFTDSRPGERKAAVREARRAGARVVRITLDWSLVAPSGDAKPGGFEAADPGDLAYRWGYVDDAVRDAAARRLRVLLVVVRAPGWAQSGRRPDPGELAAFMRAAARRFSGYYPDPKDTGDGLTEEGKSLPAVRLWQVWERANLLAGGVPHYRRMLRGSAAAVNRVDGANVLVAGGTVGRGAGGFWRRLRGARFDVAAHRGVSGLRRLRRIARRPLWVTEVARDTPPLNPRGMSPGRQARFLVRALYTADRARAALFSWHGLQDRTSHLPNFGSIASGLFFNRTNSISRDPDKPARRAFRFPFLVRGSQAWGIAPRGRMSVVIERRRGDAWRLVTALRTSRSGEFSQPISAGGGRYRARQGQAHSLRWTR
jgi:hypothetical protein